MKTTRRDFLKVSGTAGAGLVLAFHLPSSLQAAPEAGGPFQPNVWLRIDPSGKVTITCHKSEMGQGVRTSLPMTVAEELDADFATVSVQQAMGDPKYGQQLTGGSSSVRGSMEKLRKAGATARAMLVAAAAKEWGVQPSACHTDKGYVLGPGGKRSGYGSLASAASKLPVPADVKLKDPKDFKIIGKPLPRTDLDEKVTGKAEFGIDVRVPGMMVASIARCPVFGGQVSKVDDTKAKAVPGVKQVVQIKSGVAVVGDSYWSALKGRQALQITWDEGKNAGMSSEQISQHFAELAKGEAHAGEKKGDAAAALAHAAQKLEATYEFPFLPHATMEPMNAVAHVKGDALEIWAPTQFPEMLRDAAATVGVNKDKVKIHITYLGGGFGRRAMPDFVAEAVHVSKAVGAPVKVVWSREDDMQHDFYRPASYHRLRGGVDQSGKLVAWQHRVVAPSIGSQFGWVKEGDLDKDALDAAMELPYNIPNVLIEYVMANTGVPAGWWRSVYASQNSAATESFLDELAAAAKRDPLDFRLALAAPRAAGVLKLAADKAGWGKTASGRAQGIAMAFSFGSYVAHVAEVEMMQGSAPRLRRIVAAVDCGMYVNPAIIEAQIMSAVVYGLSGMRSAITVQNGRVQQTNFHDYEIPRLNEVPSVEVHLVKNGEKPGGIGEPGLPPLAPAVLNAMAAATGKRIRKLPLTA